MRRLQRLFPQLMNVLLGNPQQLGGFTDAALACQRFQHDAQPAFGLLRTLELLHISEPAG